jgi:hypothetical protein
MANNLFVSYDLMKADKNYDAVIAQIKILGSWAKIHYSLWYVKSELDVSQAAQRVWAVMDSNDRLLVIDAKNNRAAWFNLDKEVEQFIQSKWNT